jgi:outer membrane lipoprotein SlyB
LFWSRSLGAAADFAGVVGALVGAALGRGVDCAVGRAVGRAVGDAVGEGEDWVGAFARGKEGQGRKGKGGS